MSKDFCEYCGAPLNGSEKLVTVYRHSRGQHFIFQGVPARVAGKSLPVIGDIISPSEMVGDV